MTRGLPTLRVAALGTLLLVSGCTGAPEAAPAPTVTVTATAPAPSPSPSSVASSAAGVQCSVVAGGETFSLSTLYTLAAASRGDSDHDVRVEELADQAGDFAADAEGCPWAVEAAKFAFDVAFLNVAVKLSGEGDEGDYRQVCTSGNDLRSAVGEDRDFGVDIIDGESWC